MVAAVLSSRARFVELHTTRACDPLVGMGLRFGSTLQNIENPISDKGERLSADWASRGHKERRRGRALQTNQ